MKTLYLDCSMGAAGDMLTAALLELYGDRESFLHAMNGLGLPGVSVSAEDCVKSGIAGTHVSVRVHGHEEDEHPHHVHHTHHELHEHEHHTHHEHHDHGHHTHRTLPEILAYIQALPLSRAVRDNAAAVYRLLAQAEGKVHGRSAGEVHFHEVGTLDAVADVVGVCWLLEKLSPERILASPVHVGSGSVRCAHGILSVPAPATAELLRGVPIYAGDIDGELCTPTGAALLRHFVQEFVPLPTLRVSAVGWGMGKRDYPRVNGLRAFLGQEEHPAETVCELCCNLDDMSGEELGYVQERLWQQGALDVYTLPIGMKKSRPGIQLWCMCRREDKERLAALLLRSTSSWGVRVYETERITLPVHTRRVETPWGAVTVKEAKTDRVNKWKCEYREAARLAAEQDVPLRAVLEEVSRAYRGEK